MIKKITIKLDTYNKAVDFVHTCAKYDYDIDVYSNRYIIDAKSILGVFSLDLAHSVSVTIHDADKEIIDKFEKDMEQFKEK